MLVQRVTARGACPDGLARGGGRERARGREKERERGREGQKDSGRDGERERGRKGERKRWREKEMEGHTCCANAVLREVASRLDARLDAWCRV